MNSTIDFATMNDDEILYGYQRVNRSRFPGNFIACTAEIAKRGLPAPEKFEINPLGAATAFSAFQKLSDAVASLAASITKRVPSPQA